MLLGNTTDNTPAALRAAATQEDAEVSTKAPVMPDAVATPVPLPPPGEDGSAAAAAAAAAVPLPNVTDTADISVAVDGRPAGVIVLGLYGGAAPNQVAKFAAVCAGEATKDCIYAGTPLLQTMPGVLQGGDCELRNGLGTFGWYVDTPSDPNISLPMGRGALLSPTRLPNTGGAQFVVISRSLDGRLNSTHLVFGRVLSGLDLVDMLASPPPRGSVVITGCSMASTTPFSAATPQLVLPPQPTADPLGITQTVDLDVSVGGRRAGIVSIGLFGNAVPNSVAKFTSICRGSRPGCSFAGSSITRVVNDFMIQGGSCLNDSSGSWTVYADTPPDQRSGWLPFDSGAVAFAAPADWTSGSQFFIPFAPAPWLNGQHMVFGHVLAGLDLVRAVGNSSTLEDGRPMPPVTIAACRVNNDAANVTALSPPTNPANASVVPKPISIPNDFKVAQPQPLESQDVTDTADISVAVGGRPAGAIVLGLYGRAAPNQVAKFASICAGNSTFNCTYVGTPMLRTLPSVLQGGDCELFNSRGTFGWYTDTPSDPNITLTVDRGALLSPTRLPNTGGAQFAVAAADQGALTGRHQVFGRVLSGLDLVDALTDATRDLRAAIAITGCRMASEPFASAMPQLAALAGDDAATALAAGAGAPPANTTTAVTQTVDLDVSIGGRRAGIVSIGLFGNAVPNSVAKFTSICRGSRPGCSFAGSSITRVVNDFMIQGGSCLNDSSGSWTVYADTPADPPGSLLPFDSGAVAFAAPANWTSGSQFFIPFVRTPWLNGQHVVFGRVLAGLDLVRAVGGRAPFPDGRPRSAVTIDGCRVNNAPPGGTLALAEAAARGSAPPATNPTSPSVQPPAVRTMQTTVTQRGQLNVDIDGKPARWMIFGLYGDAFPNAVATFKRACKGDKGLNCSYAGTPITRVEPWMVQGGDCQFRNGSGGWGVFNGTEPDGPPAPVTAYSLVMADQLPSTGGSQFFITTRDAPWLNGKHAVIGRVLGGTDLVQKMVQAKGRNVTITRCRLEYGRR